MVYRKNLPAWERIARISAGLGLGVLGWIVLEGRWAPLLAAGAGLVAASTGILGFCPMCAMVGRRLGAKAGSP